MDTNEAKRMKVLCKPDKTTAVKRALQQAGAECINMLRTQYDNVVLYCTGTMSMKDIAENAGAESFEVALKQTA